MTARPSQKGGAFSPPASNAGDLAFDPAALAPIRVDKWLWQARFFKSRSLAADMVSEGRLRIAGQPVDKPAKTVKPGDVLTFPQAGHIRVVRILAAGTRRGPAQEAQSLYVDLAPLASGGGDD